MRTQYSAPMYTSHDYASDHPTLTLAQAKKIIRDHGLDFVEASCDLWDGQTPNTVDTLSLIEWMGY